MVQLRLPKNSVPVEGKKFSNIDGLDEAAANNKVKTFKVYRWSGNAAVSYTHLTLPTTPYV